MRLGSRFLPGSIMGSALGFGIPATSEAKTSDSVASPADPDDAEDEAGTGD